jgi:hypothetical protein
MASPTPKAMSPDSPVSRIPLFFQKHADSQCHISHRHQTVTIVVEAPTKATAAGSTDAQVCSPSPNCVTQFGVVTAAVTTPVHTHTSDAAL